MDPLELLAHWDIALVAGATLASVSGLPIPAEPVLVAAGALAQDGIMRADLVLLAAVASSLVADHAWFLLGRFRGRAVLAGICRISLSPDTCVRQTDNLIARHGAALLVVAKFLPGISLVAIPTSAAMGLSYRRFILYDTLGCVAWCGTCIGAGMIFSHEVRDLIGAMARIGGWSVLVMALLFGIYIGAKLLHRRRLRRLYHLVRIAPNEVAELLAAGDTAVVILDARSRLAREEDPREFRGAIVFEDGQEIDALPLEVRTKIVVTFCTCPNEASAALLAERLIRAGYEQVRVLTGGKDALAVLGT